MGQGSRPIRQRSAVRRTYWSALAVLVPVLTVLAAPAQARAQGNEPSDAEPLTLDIAEHGFSNATANANESDILTCGGAIMAKTVWFRFTGDGLPTTVTTAATVARNPPGENRQPDTVMAVYRKPAAADEGPGGLPPASHRIACNDDAAFPTDFTSRLTFTSVKGQEYLVQ